MATKLFVRSTQKDPFFIIIISMIIASVLTVYPLPYEIAGWRPHFMLILTLFWVMCQPSWCGVWFAFTMGIFTDLLLGMPLGANALCFVILSFSARLLTREFAYIPFLFLWLMSGLTTLIYTFVIWLGLIATDTTFITARHWQPLLTSIVIFPLFFWLLKRWRV